MYYYWEHNKSLNTNTKSVHKKTRWHPFVRFSKSGFIWRPVIFVSVSLNGCLTRMILKMPWIQTFWSGIQAIAQKLARRYKIRPWTLFPVFVWQNVPYSDNCLKIKYVWTWFISTIWIPDYSSTVTIWIPNTWILDSSEYRTVWCTVFKW